MCDSDTNGCAEDLIQMGVARGAKEKGKGTHKHTHKHDKHDALGSNAIALLAVTLLFTVILLYILHVPKPPPQVTVTIKPPEWKWTSPLTVVPTVGVIALVVYAFVKLWLNRRGAHGSELNGQMLEVIRALTGTLKVKGTLAAGQNTIHVEGLQLAAAAERDIAEEAAAATARRLVLRDLNPCIAQETTKAWSDVQDACKNDNQIRLTGLDVLDEGGAAGGLMAIVRDMQGQVQVLQGQIKESAQEHKNAMQGIQNSLGSIQAPVNNDASELRSVIAALQAHATDMSATMEATVRAQRMDHNQQIHFMLAQTKNLLAGNRDHADANAQFMYDALLSNMSENNIIAVAEAKTSSEEMMALLAVATEAMTNPSLASNARFAAAMGMGEIKDTLDSLGNAIDKLAAYNPREADDRFGDGLATAAEVTRFVENVKGMCQDECDADTLALIDEVQGSLIISEGGGGGGTQAIISDEVRMKVKDALRKDMERIKGSQNDLITSAYGDLAFLNQAIGDEHDEHEQEGQGEVSSRVSAGGNIHEMMTLYLMQVAARRGLMRGASDVNEMKAAHEEVLDEMIAAADADAVTVQQDYDAAMERQLREIKRLKEAASQSTIDQKAKLEKEQALERQILSLKSANITQSDAASQQNLKIRFLQSNLAESRAERKIMEGNETKLNEAASVQEQVLADLKGKFEESEKKASDFALTNASLDLTIGELQQDMRAGAAADAVTAATFQREIAGLQQRVRVSQALRDGLETQETNLRAELGFLTQKTSTQTTDALSQTKKIHVLEDELTETVKSRNSLRQSEADLVATAARLKGELEESQKKAQKLVEMRTESNVAASRAAYATTKDREEIKAIQQEIAGYKRQAHMAQESVNLMEASENKLKDQIFKLQSDIQSQRGFAAEESRGQRSQIGDLNRQLEDSRNARVVLAQQVADQFNAALKSETELAGLQENLHKSEAMAAGLTEGNAALGTEVEALQRELRESTAKKVETEQQILTVQVELDSLRERLGEADEATRTSEVRAMALGKESESLKQDANTNRERIGFLEAAIEDSALERVQMQQAREGLVAAAEQRKDTLAELQATYGELQESNTALQALVDDSSAVSKKLEEDMVRLQLDSEDMVKADAKERGMFSNEISRARRNENWALKAAGEQQGELDTLRSTLRGRRSEVEEQGLEIKTLKEARAKLQETHNRKIEDLRAQMKGIDDDNAALQHALNEASTEIERLNGQVREKEDEITNLHAMAEKIEKMAVDSLVDTAALEEENARLVQANEDLGKIRGELTNLEESSRRVLSELTQNKETNALLEQRMKELNTRYDQQVDRAEKYASHARRATLSKNEMRSKLTAALMGVKARQGREKQKEKKKYARLVENPVIANAQFGPMILKTTEPVDVRSSYRRDQKPPPRDNVNFGLVKGRVNTIEEIEESNRRVAHEEAEKTGGRQRQRASATGEGAGAVDMDLLSGLLAKF